MTKEKPDDPCDNDKFTRYVETIGECEDYENLQEWIEELEGLELDDVVPLVLDLEDGKWVDISNYC